MPTAVSRAQIHLASPAAEVFAWHESPGAFEALTPPGDDVEVLERHGTIRDGDRLVLRVGVAGPVRLTWTAVHEGFVAGREFTDVLHGGPFSIWRHRHLVLPDPNDPRRSWLHDELTWRLRGGPLAHALGAPLVRRRLAALFAHRHVVFRRLFGDGDAPAPTPRSP